MSFWKRTSQVLTRETMRAVRMEGADEPSRLPRTLFTMNSTQDMQGFLAGCDADNGGTSTMNLELDHSTETHPIVRKPTARFFGHMRLQVKPGSKLPRGGYAAFKSKDRPTLFGNILEDIEWHRYLALRLRVSGDPQTYNSYFVNCQTEGPFETDLWQHRLYFKRPNDWEDIFIPFSNFVLTHGGHAQDSQITMGNKLRSVGIALLGGHSNTSGQYELAVDSFRIVNEEDTKSPFIEPQSEPVDESGWEKL